MPEQSGYYWLVNTAHPVPYVVYFHDYMIYSPHNGPFDFRLYKEFRFGDKIVEPNYLTNIIEY